jgi:membrane protein
MNCLNYKIKKRTINFFILVKESAVNFIADDALKFSASLSYYTIFSIAPMLIIAIAIGSFLFGRTAIEGHLFEQINSIVGNDAALQIQEMLRHTTLRRNNTMATIIGIVVFFIGATGVFGEIQSTINRIWGLKAKPKKGIIKYVVNRVLSFAMVISIGFLMVVSLMASALIKILNTELNTFLPDTTFIIVIVNNSVSLLIISLLFAVVFKYLPDSSVKWKDAWIGSLFTSALFLLGKYLIGLYLSTSSGASAYGAAGSVIILLLWIYYSSILLYFGAEFTKSYALKHGSGIYPNLFSVRVEYEEKEIKTVRPW